jgi:hypothetical protein
MNDSNPSVRVIIAVLSAITIAALIILSGGSLRRNYEHTRAGMIHNASAIPVTEATQP